MSVDAMLTAYILYILYHITDIMLQQPVALYILFTLCSHSLPSLYNFVDMLISTLHHPSFFSLYEEQSIISGTGASRYYKNVLRMYNMVSVGWWKLLCNFVHR
jgi:hypothetical protein